VCGKNRRRPPSEEAENDPLADAPADSPYAAFLSTLRGPGKSVTGPLLQDVRLGEPVRVFTGPPHAPSEVAPGEAKTKGKSKSKTAKGKKSDDSKVANTAKSTPEAKKKAAAKKDAKKETTKKKEATKKETTKKETTKKEGAKKDAQATAKVTAKTKSGAKKSETPAKQ
jgi:hypothetical protein